MDGFKTQTRRLLKPQPMLQNGMWRWKDCQWKEGGAGFPQSGIEDWFWKPGTVLWVRETYRRISFGFPIYEYKADNHPKSLIPWKPSIHMPRAACRLRLIVEALKVERLQEISQNDAISEGVLGYDGWQTPEYKKAVRIAKENGTKPPLGFTPKEAFAHLWNKINKKPGAKWDDNPFVQAITFSVRR
jgi:hypothetical protein